MKKSYKKISIILLCSVVFMYINASKLMANNVPDNIELEALKQLYIQTNGDGWTTKTNWPTLANWPATATSAEFSTWHGVNVADGDITQIALAVNQLTGSIPLELGNLTSLQSLSIFNNQLSGSIPSELGNLTSLQTLYLFNNQLTGSIPLELGNLTSLQYLNLSNNQLSGGIPLELGNLTSLRSLGLQINQLLGGIPSELGNLTSLQSLNLSANPLTGSIPLELGNLTSLQSLYLVSNQLTGSIPLELGNLTSLQSLYLNSNQLTGSIPSELGNMTSLQTLDLNSNQLSGSIPATLGDLLNLQNLDLNNNLLTGSIPSELGNMTSLQALDLYSNQLSGSIPSELGNLTSLQTLNLSANQLTGSIPVALVNSTSLQEAYFNNNKFTSVPDFSSHANALNLYLNISNNHIPYGDIEQNLTGSSTHGFSIFTYLPQTTTVSVPPLEKIIIEGSMLEINAVDVGLNHTYVWEKQDESQVWLDVTSLNQSPTASSYIINSTTQNDAGLYRYSVSNSWVGGSALIYEPTLISNATVASIMADFGFQYKYDERQRMVAKKVPGAEWVYMVYDKWDRLVLTQDGNQRDPLKGNGVEWSITKYDVLNRPIMTGVYLSSDVAATHISNMVTYARNETTDPSPTGAGYTLSASYPVVVEGDLQTITYYDNYTFPRTATLDFVPELDNAAYNTMVRGQVTGSRVRNLATQDWLELSIYYDNKYRVIQSLAENQLGGVDRTSNRYDFIGKVLETKTSHDDKQITRAFEYDHADRLLSSNHKLKQTINWVNVVNLDVNGNVLTKSIANSWTSGASSSNILSKGIDGGVEAIVQIKNKRLMIGFSDIDANQHYNTIDYALYTYIDGTIRVYENGSHKSNLGAYNAGDELSVERIGTTINYKINGEIKYVSTVSNDTDLLVDLAVYDTGSKVDQVYMYEIPVQIAQNNYNELGQLIEKNLHSIDQGTTFEQSVDYDYNIRGWLTSINNASLTSTVSNDDTDQLKDYWGMELGYDQPLGGIIDAELAFNGNISAVKWSDEAGLNAASLNPITERAYLYKYDPMNRILEADQKKKIGFWVDEDAYDLRGMQYDLNGNIQTLTRKDKAGANMDFLAYTYDGNKLLKVDDNGNDTEGFKDGSNVDNDYAYDDNGNMTSDLNKDIAAIDYNYLNLPEKVTMADGKYITYQYDAAGIKLAQEVYDNVAVLQKRTDYVGEFIYETAGTAERKLQFIQHEEGRVVAKSEKTAMDIEWTFNSDTEGFTSIAGISGFQQSLPGHLEGTVTSNDPIFRSPDNLNFEANKYDIVRIRLENNTSSVTAQLFFTTTTATSESESKSLRFTTTPNSGYTDYVLDMSSVSTWSGTIKRLRFDPGNQLGDFKVDNIIVEGNFYIEEYEYQYHLKDHLGNTRLTFTTKNEVDEYLATMETSFAEIEQPYFANWEDTRHLDNEYDHTDALTIFNYSAMLQGKTGPGMLLQVLPGDVVDMEVYAKYADDASTKGENALGSAILASLTNGFSTVGAGETTVLDYMFNGAATQGAILLGDQDNGTDVPEGYLQYLLFDENNDPLTDLEGLTGYAPVTDAAEGAFQKLELAQLIVPAKARYMFIFVLNASTGKPVHFDDLKITHTKNKIVQMDDYYPFGLSFNSFQRQDKLKNKFLFQGQEHDEETGWDQFKWRNHQPDIGRFFNVDPLAEDYYWWSPYAFSGNIVINARELEGLEPAYVNPNSGIRNSRSPSRTARRSSKRPARKTGWQVASYRNQSSNPTHVRKTNYSTSRGNGGTGHQTSSGAQMGFRDNQHSFGNTSGNLVKLLGHIADRVMVLVEESKTITTNESLVESGVATISTGVTINFDSDEKTAELASLQESWTGEVMNIARGDLSAEEFNALEPEKQILIVQLAKIAAGPSPIQIVQSQINEKNKLDETVVTSPALYQGN